MSLNRFKDKNILITGAAVGIGKATAYLLARQGAKLVLIDLDVEKLKLLVDELRGSDHIYYKCDLSNIDGIETIILSIQKEGIVFDGLVHCVGIRSRRPLKLLTSNHIEQVMRINYGSFIELVRLTTKRNRFNKNYSIIAISSISSKVGGAGVTAYSASKAAIEAAVRSLSKELYKKGIRINTVVPGQVNTPAYAELMKLSGNDSDPVLDRQFLGLAEPIDVANLISFLLSTDSKQITGASMPVDGGFLD